jgi:ethanolaminephosphotransferase
MVPKSVPATTTMESFSTTDDESGLAASSSDAGDSYSYSYYLTPDARQELPKYQYRGCDKSLVYHYILSPLAASCVDHLVPRNVAPNSITLFGLVWMMTAYGIYWWYAPALEVVDEEASPLPRWIFLWNAIAMLAYQTLDNMDGKQARRTGSSSPLGLLFDHGCDAVNSIFGSANWIIGMGLVPRDNLLSCWALIFGPFCMFYIATWEQYITGELIMPIVNGPNEGLLGGAMLSLTSYWIGSSYWQGTDWYEALQSQLSPFLVVPKDLVLRNCDLVVLVASIGFLQEILSKLFAVTRKYSGAAVWSLVPFFVLSLCYLAIGAMEPNVWLSIPRTSLHLAMIVFVEMSTEIMLAHVTAQRFHPWGRWHVLPLVGLTLWIAVRGNDPLLEYWIIAYTWSMGAYLIMKMVLVIHEICNTLEIWCFDIVTPHPKRVGVVVLPVAENGIGNSKEE